MISLFLPLLILSVISTVAMIALYATITQEELLQPVSVNAYDFPVRPLTSADTVACSSAMTKTVFAPPTDWQTVTVQHLGDVTDLLDYLENRGIEQKEVVTLANNSFAVRWK
jgi:hypothetical protein